MPLLLNVLRNATGADYRKLLVKAMECAGLIGAFYCGIGLSIIMIVFKYVAIGRKYYDT
jgi:hypothetical protein